MKTAQLWLPYFKQGDDLYDSLASSNSNFEALSQQAKMLRESADVLMNVAEAVKDQDVDFEAYGHTILVTGHDEVIDEMIFKGLFQELEGFDELENEEYDEMDEFDEDEQMDPELEDDDWSSEDDE